MPNTLTALLAVSILLLRGIHGFTAQPSGNIEPTVTTIRNGGNGQVMVSVFIREANFYDVHG